MKDNQIRGGALISYLGIAISIVTGLIYTPWILRTIGNSDYGLYTLAISLISIFVMDFGVSAAVTRYSAIYLARGEKTKSNEIVGLAYKLFFFIDILVALVLIIVFFLIGSIYKELTPDEITKFKDIYIIIAIYNVIQFPFTNLNGVLNAYEKFIQLKLGDLVNKIFIVVVTVIALLLGGNLYDLVFINAIGGIVNIVFKGIMVHKYTECKPSFLRNSSVKMSEIVEFSAWSTIISIASRGIFLLTPSVLGAFSGTFAITIFGFSSTLENYVFLTANGLNGLFLPKVARISVGDERNTNLLLLMKKVGRIQIYIIGLILIGFTVLGDWFIKMWLGEEYSILYPCTLLLILPSYINLPQQIANTTMTVENHVKEQAVVYVMMATINIVLSIWFSQLWGALGACVSIFIAYIFRVVAMNYFYKKKLKIDIKSFFKDTFFKILPWQILVAIIGITIKYLFGKTFDERISFCIVGLLIVILYAVIIYVFTLNEEEKSFIRRLIRR